MNDLLVNKEAIRLKYLNDLGLNVPDLNDLNSVDTDSIDASDFNEYISKFQTYISWLETLVSEKLTKERKLMSMREFWERNYSDIRLKGSGYRVYYDKGLLDHEEIDAIHKIKKHESRD